MGTKVTYTFMNLGKENAKYHISIRVSCEVKQVQPRVIPFTLDSPPVLWLYVDRCLGHFYVLQRCLMEFTSGLCSQSCHVSPLCLFWVIVVLKGDPSVQS